MTAVALALAACSPGGKATVDASRASPHASTPEPALSVEIQRQAKAYPLRIMVWHEIVNDTVGGTPVTVTNCPLCNTGITFVRPVIDGKLLDFGTSGKLYNSNLVMYTGFARNYGTNPCGGYAESPVPFLFSGKADRRLPLLTYVLGVVVGDDAVAFPLPTPFVGKQLKPVLATDSFWFDWAAFHPDTRIYGQE